MKAFFSRWHSLEWWEKLLVILTFPITLPMFFAGVIAMSLVGGVICFCELVFGE